MKDSEQGSENRRGRFSAGVSKYLYKNNDKNRGTTETEAFNGIVKSEILRHIIVFFIYAILTIFAIYFVIRLAKHRMNTVKYQSQNIVNEGLEIENEVAKNDKMNAPDEYNSDLEEKVKKKYFKNITLNKEIEERLENTEGTDTQYNTSKEESEELEIIQKTNLDERNRLSKKGSYADRNFPKGGNTVSSNRVDANLRIESNTLNDEAKKPTLNTKLKKQYIERNNKLIAIKVEGKKASSGSMIMVSTLPESEKSQESKKSEKTNAKKSGRASVVIDNFESLNNYIRRSHAVQSETHDDSVNFMKLGLEDCFTGLAYSKDIDYALRSLRKYNVNLIFYIRYSENGYLRHVEHFGTASDRIYGKMFTSRASRDAYYDNLEYITNITSAVLERNCSSLKHYQNIRLSKRRNRVLGRVDTNYDRNSCGEEGTPAFVALNSRQANTCAILEEGAVYYDREGICRQFSNGLIAENKEGVFVILKLNESFVDGSFVNWNGTQVSSCLLPS